MNRFLAALLLAITGLMGLTRHPDHVDNTKAEMQQISIPVIQLNDDEGISAALEASGWLISRSIISVSEKTTGKNAEPVRNIF